MVDAQLHRYWFRLDHDTHRSVCPQGCGVAAWTEDDAKALIEAALGSVPLIREIVADVDLSTLDPNHVLPNMRSPVERGIWFPMGF